MDLSAHAAALSTVTIGRHLTYLDVGLIFDNSVVFVLAKVESTLAEHQNCLLSVIVKINLRHLLMLIVQIRHIVTHVIIILKTVLIAKAIAATVAHLCINMKCNVMCVQILHQIQLFNFVLRHLIQLILT